MKTLFVALVLSVVTVVHAAPFPSPTDWRNENIYQILTDRYYDGNPSNDNVEASHGSPYAPTANNGIHGGDFQGIQDKLDYIKALGATAIWISPIPSNVGGTSAYHGYGAQDFYTLAPHWGTMTDLSNMVQAAHARGIKVILDIVCNHTGDLIGSTDSGYPTFKAPPAGYHMSYWNNTNQHAFPFNPTNVVPAQLSTIFHTNGEIQSFTYPSGTQQVVLGELDGLDDLATETTYVRTNLMNIYTNWIGLADFDAFRVDTAIEVDYGFWQYWCPQIHQYGITIGKSNFFMFCEADSGNEQQIGSYTGTEGGGPFKFDATLDYALFYNCINSVFATASGNTAQIISHYNYISTYYDSNSWYRLITFLDNHDNARFLSSGNANGNTNNLTVGLQFLYTSRGIPSLYYGTEQGFEGDNNNNDNREDMFAGGWQPQVPVTGDNFNETSLLFQQVARLNNFRRLYPALCTGVQNNLASNSSSPGIFAYSRVFGNEEVFVCLNTASSSQNLTSCPTTYTPGTVLVNLLNTNDTITVISGAGTNETPAITVTSMTTKIYISRPLVLPLDPVVVSQSPSHAATCVSASAPIELQFSKPMNTNSVQAAFSVTPSASGTFTWDTLHDTMTFTPSTAWPVFITNLVHLATNAVDSVSSNSFYAPFDTYFVTFTTNKITTSSSPPVGGTTSGGGGAVNCGSNVTVCATPNACYSFVYWTEDGSLVSTSACYSFSVTNSETLVANFVNGQGVLAIDDAADPSYSSGWSTGTSGGTGFDPWVLLVTTPDPSCNGFFVSSSTSDPSHTPPGIDVSGNSWGIYANDVYCLGPITAAAFRPFALGPVQVGGQLLIDMDNGYNDMDGSEAGFTLRNGDATNSPTDWATGARLKFLVVGLETDYMVIDAAGSRDTGVPVTYSGLHLSFALGTNDSYTLTIISYGTGSTNVISGTLGGTPGTTLDSIALFDSDNGIDPPRDMFFNSLLVAYSTPITYAIDTSSLPPAGGTTSGSGDVNCGSNATVTAAPNGGYGFVNWTQTGTMVSVSSSYSFTATANRALTANFTTELSPFQAWQLQYFGCTNCPMAAPGADPLGKGMSNTNQFLAGLNPTNGASTFRITSMVTQSKNVAVTWTTAGVRTNAVQATAGGTNGSYATNFVDISGPIILPVSGDTVTNYLDIGGATSKPARYYRVRLVP